MSDIPQGEPHTESKVLVNGHHVNIYGHQATGLEIKERAIEQGVQITVECILNEERADGAARVIADGDVLHLQDDMKFLAIPADDAVFVILVNEQKVLFREETATGLAIKQKAIADGVLIEVNFILQEELPNGTSRVIGDTDVVHLRDHMKFTAITPDDNS
jgi:hypothetical protein